MLSFTTRDDGTVLIEDGILCVGEFDTLADALDWVDHERSSAALEVATLRSDLREAEETLGDLTSLRSALEPTTGEIAAQATIAAMNRSRSACGPLSPKGE
jgi:hypothetical protein